MRWPWSPQPQTLTGANRHLELESSTSLSGARPGSPPRMRNALTAAAQAISQSRKRLTPNYESWQREVWAYYDALGEFRNALDWHGQMVSRVRLRAGEIVPGKDEPKLVSSGDAAELIDELGGSIGARSQMMYDFTIQLGAPGECWLTGETLEDGTNEWLVRSTDEIRRSRQGKTSDSALYEVIDLQESTNTEVVWRNLNPESLVVRVWRQHARLHHRADSPARAAVTIMRELELVNRHIVAQYLSRLASAGVFIMPEEVTFPVREEFKDDADPFVSEWIETAKEAIKTPGTAAATIPIPMRVPADYADKFNHIDFTLKLDDKILEKRESALKRLATALDLPAEVLLGLGDVSHWSAWQLEESAIKTHIAPMVEQIVHSLTIGYLHPQLKARGVKDVRKWVVWYDPSEITLRPDRSEAAKNAYDRLEISGESYRRESGFDEDDAPNDEELAKMMLMRASKNPAVVLPAVEMLTGQKFDPVEDNSRNRQKEDEEKRPVDDPSIDRKGTPDTQDEPPPTPGKTPPATPKSKSTIDPLTYELRALVARAEEAQRQLRNSERHWLARRFDGMRIQHPEICNNTVITCPFDEALKSATIGPGRTGVYECWLEDDEKRLVVGALRMDLHDQVSSLIKSGSSNGH